MMHKQKGNGQKGQRGQSFVELAIVLSLLIFMLAGVVEFGYLLNQYITLVEGTRETARVLSPQKFFDDSGVPNNDLFVNGAAHLGGGLYVLDGENLVVAPESSSIWPITLDETIGDDIIISIFSINDDGTLIRYPDDDGYSRFGNETSRFSDADISAKLVSGAPKTGAVLVEVFYHYHQILNLLEGWTGPIAVHAYSILPLAGAEPD
ncbi:MAG: pilus assembly protein [Anaerolineae bacterium]|nr:pilus assembly protein [Anaerolineae bacterium]